MHSDLEILILVGVVAAAGFLLGSWTAASDYRRGVAEGYIYAHSPWRNDVAHVAPILRKLEKRFEIETTHWREDP